jgi:hypothetical protein
MAVVATLSATPLFFSRHALLRKSLPGTVVALGYFARFLQEGLGMRRLAKRTVISIVVLLAFTGGIFVCPYAATSLQSTKSQKKQINQSQKKQIKPQKREKRPLRRAGKDYKVKKGAEVAAKVRKLKESNKNVRAALKLFEDKKRMPKVDASFSINGSLSSLNVGLNDRDRLFQNVSFEQQSSISGDYIEIIFVPVLSQDMEWQGIVISDLYDWDGNNVGEYVALSVLIMPDPDFYAWDEIYEAPVNNGVVEPAIAEPWMFTNIDLGVPLDQQVLSVEIYQAKPSSVIRLVPASYVQGGPARIRAWANCTFGWCGGAGINCVGTAVWSADALISSCFASGCGDYAIGCAWETIWQF